MMTRRLTPALLAAGLSLAAPLPTRKSRPRASSSTETRTPGAGPRPRMASQPSANPDGVRFAGVMQAALGDGFEVVVDGLSNRTTNTDDFMDWGNVDAGALNGAAHLPAAIAHEMPLDLVVLMLGTNDLKAGFDRSPDDIARGALAAQSALASTGIATEYPAPRVVVVTPPPLGTMNHPGIAEFLVGGPDKSRDLDRAFETAFGTGDVVLLRASDMMGATDGFDGVHFTPDDHSQLGRALADEVRTIVGR